MTRSFLVAVLLFAGPGHAWAQASVGAPAVFKPAPPATPPTETEPAQKKAQAAAAPPSSSSPPPAAVSSPPAPISPGAPPPEGAPQASPPPVYHAPPPGYAYPAYPYQPYPNAYYPYAPAPPPPGRHQHDGFFLRMNFGFGGSDFKTANAGSTTEIRGGGIDFAIALGGALTRHLILYGEICEGATFPDPTLRVNGESRGTGSDVIFVSVGPGVAYYFGESNYFLSGSLSLVQLTFEGFDIDRSRNSSEDGVSFRALFGKEWWVSNNWGMGAALALTLSSVRDKYLQAANANGDTPRWSTGSIGMLFSATYN